MTERNYGIVGVGAHYRGGAQASTVICHHLASAYILVVQLREIVGAYKQEVLFQELKFEWLSIFLKQKELIRKQDFLLCWYKTSKNDLYP